MRARPILLSLVALAGLAVVGGLELRRHLGREITSRGFFAPVQLLPLTEWTDAPGRERYTLRAADGTILRGYRYPGSSRRSIAYFYGALDHVATVDPWLATLRDKSGMTVVCVDYRASGFTEGEPTFEHERSDAETLVRALMTRDGEAPIVYGFSVGTTLATAVAAEHRAAAVILQAAPSTAREYLTHEAWKYGPFAAQVWNPTPDATLAFDNVARAAQITTPLLVLQGRSDRVVPFAQGRAVYEAAPPGDKSFVETVAGHEWNLANDPALPQLLAFLAAHAR